MQSSKHATIKKQQQIKLTNKQIKARKTSIHIKKHRHQQQKLYKNKTQKKRLTKTCRRSEKMQQQQRRHKKTLV